MAGAKRICQVLVLFFVITYATARSDGAPSGACSTFTPQHTMPQSGDGGFKIYSTVIDNGGTYVAEQAYTVTLHHQDNTTQFKGFLIGARDAVSNDAVGSFTITDSANSKIGNCGDSATVTHPSNGSKTMVSMTWTAPSTGGTVKFRYAVVMAYTTYYADLETPYTIAPTTTTTTSIGTTVTPSSSIECPVFDTATASYNLEFGLPSGCQKDTCTYYVSMGPNTANAEYLDVLIEGDVEGWVAVGFSQDQLMPNTDVLGCKIENGAITVLDGWNPGYSNMADDNQSGICVHSTTYTNGRLSCSFSRLGGDGSDSKDLQLNNDLWLFFARKTTAQSPSSAFSKHSTSPMLSDVKYNPFTDSRTLPTAVTSSPSDCPPSPPSSATYPVSVTVSESNYFFAARINDNNHEYLDIMLAADTEGWVAIGFSNTEQMSNTDVLACKRESATDMVNVLDTWNPEPNRSPNQLDADQSGICAHSAEYNNGRISCTFSRYIPGVNSADDVYLIAVYYRIYAVSSQRGESTSGLLKHDNRPIVTTEATHVISGSAGNETVVPYPKEALIRTHGILMILSWPLLASTAVFFASWMKPALPNGEWFQIHRALMIVSLFTTAIGFIFAFVANARSPTPGLIEFGVTSTIHFVFGIIIFALQIANPLIAIFRCAPSAPRRWIFNLSHAAIIGFGALLLALINIGLGIGLGIELEIFKNAFWILGIYLFYLVFLVALEVVLYIVFLTLAMNAPAEDRAKLVHSSAKYFFAKPKKIELDKVEFEKNEVEIKPFEKSDQVTPPAKTKKPPSKDAPVRWIAVGIFLSVTALTELVLIILISVD